MKKLLLAFFLLTSCSSSEDGNQQQAGGGTPTARKVPDGTARPNGGAIAKLTGLYEGNGTPRHQMCVVEGKNGEERFGLIVWGSNQNSCMGSGTITRNGERVRLAMAGDSACAIDATISGDMIKLPSSVPEGCSYYCGPRASLGGAELTQQATTREGAMQAKDIVGEPLCAGEGS